MAGRSVVTRRAVLDIVRTAVQGSYGVTGFADASFAARLRRWFRIGFPGIVLTTDGGLSVDLYLTVAYGVPVAEVARQVDSAVRYALRRATSAEVSCLSIHVDGLRYQPSVTHGVPAEPAASEPDGPAATAGEPTEPPSAAPFGTPLDADGRAPESATR